MKLILVAKADLKDTPNYDGTITLGTNFKIDIHSQPVTDVKSADHLVQKTLLLRKRSSSEVYPANFYALWVSEEVFNQINKLITAAKNVEIVDITIPLKQYHFVGYIQAQKNKTFKVVLNNDFANTQLLERVRELGNKLNVGGSELEVSYQSLGYCPRANEQGLFANSAKSNKLDTAPKPASKSHRK